MPNIKLRPSRPQVLGFQSAEFPNGKVVAQKLRDLLERFPLLFETTANDFLNQASIAEVRDVAFQLADTFFENRLKDITTDLYSLFIPDPREKQYDSHFKRVCDMLRCAALVEYTLEPKNFSITREALKNIKRRLRSNPGFFSEIESSISELIQENRWERIVTELKKHTQNGPHIGELSRAAQYLANYKSRINFNQPKSGNKTSVPVVQYNQAFANTSPSKTKEKNKKQAQLNDSPDNWFGSWNKLALCIPVAHSLQEYLIEENQNSSKSAFAACCCEIALLTSRKPKTIVNILAGETAEEEIYLRRQERGTWELQFPIINRKHFAKIDEFDFGAMASDIRLKLPQQTGYRLDLALKYTSLPTKKNKCFNFIEDQHELVRSLLIRARENVHPSISAGAISMTFAKSHFHRYHDIPLLQLITSYDFEASLFSLNYLWFEERYLQSTFQKTLQDLFPDEYDFVSEKDVSHSIGAPLAYSCHHQMNDPIKVLRELQNCYRPRERSTPSAWCDYHQKKTQYTALLLAAQMGHRITSSFNTIKLGQINFDHGLILFHDKVTTTAERRRVAALGQGALNSINDYLDHLKTLREKVEEFFPLGLKIKLIKVIDGSLSGKSCLFFSWPQPNGISDFSLVDTWKSIFPENLPKNMFRHILANELRRHEVAGVYVEAHLGHFHGVNLFGETSSISLSDFSKEICPVLDKVFAPCAKASRTKNSKTSINVRYSPRKILSTYKHEKENDHAFSLNRYRDTTSAYTDLSLNESVEGALLKNVKGYDTASPPRGIVLNQKQIDQIKKDTVKHSKPRKLKSVYEKLKYRLKELKHTKQWHLPIGYGKKFSIVAPFPIYESDFMAASWRRQALEQIKTSQNKPLECSLTFMILSGAFESEAEFDKVFIALQTDNSTIIDEQTISLDIGDLNQAFCATGHVAVCMISAKRAVKADTDITQIKKNIWHILPSELQDTWSKQSIKNLIEVSLMANRISMPPIIHASRSQVFYNRSLPVERLRAFLYPDNYKATPKPLKESPSETLIPSIRKMFNQSDLLKQELIAIVNDPDSVLVPEINIRSDLLHRGWVKSHRKLLSWKQFRTLPPAIELLAEWVEQLFAPDSNKRKVGATLAQSTISKYVNTAYEPISQLMATPLIHEAQPDEIEKFLDWYIDKCISAESADETKRIITTCIEEAGKGRLPEITRHFNSSNKSAQNIHAEVFTETEKDLMQVILGHWSNEPILSPSQVSALHSLRCLLDLLLNHGMRISEATGLTVSDIASVDDFQVIYIRNNSQRRLKTKYSRRILIFPKNTIPNPKRFVSDFQGPNKSWLTKLASDLVKLASNASGARFHLFRHSRASAFFVKAFSSSYSPLTRSHILETSRSDLGHASLVSTAMFYSHVNQFLQSKELAGFHPSFTLKSVASLMKTKRVPREFILKEPAKETSIIPLLPKPLVKRFRNVVARAQVDSQIPELTRIPKVQNDDELLIRLMYVALCRGDFEDFISVGDVSQVTVQAFLEEVQDLIEISGFFPVPKEQIDYYLDSGNRPQTESSLKKFERGKSVDIISLEEWAWPTIDLSSAESLQAIKDIYEIRDRFGRQWNSRDQQIRLHRTGYSPDQFRDIMSHSGCPLLVEMDPKLTLKARPNVPDEKMIKLPRLLIFGTLLDYKVRVAPTVQA